MAQYPSQNRQWSYGIAGALLTTILTGLMFIASAGVAAESIPAQLTDQQFWKISSESSEEDGAFRSDNLVSNEIGLQYLIPALTKTAKPGRIYMGVGPEQNFTYIAALKPKMAFIVDIRRGNLDLQLVYKALFELSKDRADFVSRLFSKKRPGGLTTKSTALEIFTAISKVETSDDEYKANIRAIKEQLTSQHKFALSETDLSGIDYVYNAFHQSGPAITYSSSSGSFGDGGMNRVTYFDLMVATDGNGESHSYLANEDNFLFLKDLETRNLLIPVVGNFGGPKAIRAVGRYLKGIDATVSAFYVSNVEQYLKQDGIWNNFCGNVASLPLDQTSTFIRSVGLTDGTFAVMGGKSAGPISELGNMVSDTKSCPIRSIP